MGKIRSGLEVLASTGVLSGTLLRAYFSLYWKSKRKSKKARARVREMLLEEGLPEDIAVRMAKLAVPEFVEALSLGRLMNLGRKREEP